MGALFDPLAYEFFVRALIAAVIVGTVCAVVGTFVVLRGIAFIGDAVAHASFPGVVAAYLLSIPFYLGAAVAAVATALAIGYVTRRARIRADTAIGVLFAGTFALGVFLYSTIQGYVADLFSFLFGYLLSIDLNDLIALAALGALVLAIVGVFWSGCIRTARRLARVPVPRARRADHRDQPAGGGDHPCRGDAGDTGRHRAAVDGALRVADGARNRGRRRELGGRAVPVVLA